MVGQRLKEILPEGGEEQIYGSLGLLLREWKGSQVVGLNLKWVISGGAGGEQNIGKWMTGSFQEWTVCKCESRMGNLVALVAFHPHSLVYSTVSSNIFK